MKVFRFATEIDRSAQRFYEEMAARAENPGVKNIFRQLAEDEARRLMQLEVRAAKTNGDETMALDEGWNVYERLRQQGDRLVVADDVAAYRLALDAERHVLHQYEAAAAAEADPVVQKILTEIAEDERQLLRELESLYDFTNVPNSFLAWGEFSNLGEFHNFGRDAD
ncbi:MAG: hypothetical protein FDZ69_03385 [Deltaproteobacteria bacterium]|nr:MAG: hypothetical protein FDZ69_03385 [Deltaproteobacteria bacterium]